MHPHRTTRARDAHRATLLIAAVIGSAALAGCSSSGGSGPVAAAPVAPAPVAPRPAFVTGGPLASVGYTSAASAAFLQARAGRNATTLNETAQTATFATDLGGRTVRTTLPLMETTSSGGVESRNYGRDTPTQKEQLTAIDARYATFAAYALIENGTVDTQAFAVGARDQAAPRSAPTAGSATYRGAALGTVVFNGEPDAVLSGDVTMNADFGAGTITGRIVDSDSPLAVELQNGTIRGADYTGTARLTAFGRAAIDTSGPGGGGAFHGSFYGPEANETAGLIDIRGTSGTPGTPSGVVGGYIAVRD